MLKQIGDIIINTDSIETIYFRENFELFIKTKTEEEMFFNVYAKDDEECFEIISKLNELLHDPRVIFIDLTKIIKD